MIRKLFFIFMTVIMPLYAMEDTVMPRYSVEDLEKSIEGMKVTITNPEDPNDIIVLCTIDEKPKATTENPSTLMQCDPVIQQMDCDPAHSVKRTLSLRSMPRHKKIKNNFSH